MSNEMEQWEIDYRKELDAEVSDGVYDMSVGGMILVTGKQGRINYLVKMQELAREITQTGCPKYRR